MARDRRGGNAALSEEIARLKGSSPVERSTARIVETRRVALRYDRPGFIVHPCSRPLASSWSQGLLAPGL